MSVLKGLVIAIAMYSKIPVPQFPWKEENMRYAICFFPLVGVISGGLLALWFFVAGRLGFGPTPVAIIASLIPVMVTGGIHVDGFMDTSDALSSWMTREKRLEILKDPHIGAFSVICLVMLAGVYLAAALEITRLWMGRGIPFRVIFVWGMTYVYARALSGISVVTFKNAHKESTLYAFVSPSHQKRAQMIMVGEAVLAAVIMTLLSPVAGPFLAVGGLLVFYYYRRRAYRDFGGTTGDLCGWFLCLAETAMAVILIAVLIAERLIVG